MAVGAAIGVTPAMELESRVDDMMRDFASDFRVLRPMLEELRGEIEQAASLSFQRAQRIPLKASTIKRKRYPRYSARANVRNTMAKRLALREIAKRGDSASFHRVTNGLRKQRSGKGTVTPKPNARILERVGGFIESLTETGAEFSIRRMGHDSIGFGTKLGGLWSIFGASGRLDFLVSEQSLDEAQEAIERVQRKHFAKSLERAGAPQQWVQEVET